MNMEKKGKRFVKKSTVIGIAAAAMGTVAMAAAAHQWSRGMLNHLQGTTEQMQQLEEKEMASFPELSVTDEGVTVSVQQCIVNGAWGIVDLKVSGYDLPEGKEPNFQTADLEVKDWGGSWSISGQFDDGLLTDGYRVIGKDGQGIETEEDGSLVQYWQDENGDPERKGNRISLGENQHTCQRLERQGECRDLACFLGRTLQQIP